MNYPKYVEINNKKYNINTDFRIAIECDRISNDENIGDYERLLAIIYLLFGDEGLKDKENHAELIRLAKIYLNCGKDYEDNGEKPDMNFAQDYDYIEASFMSDFKIDLENTNMHWWKFIKLINGLSNSELGNCCVLNNIRNLRNIDVSKIKDDKERQKIIKAQQKFALKGSEKIFTKEEQEAMDEFDKIAGLV